MVRKQKRTGSRLTRRGSTRLRLTYDAWNRPTQVESWKDANANGVQDEGEDWGLVAVYQYDGQGRRIAKIVRQVDGEEVTYQRTDYLYNEQWQVLEERTDTFEDLEGQGGARETPAETPTAIGDATHVLLLQTATRTIGCRHAPHGQNRDPQPAAPRDPARKHG
jgi:hypothetical protein